MDTGLAINFETTTNANEVHTSNYHTQLYINEKDMMKKSFSEISMMTSYQRGRHDKSNQTLQQNIREEEEEEKVSPKNPRRKAVLSKPKSNDA